MVCLFLLHCQKNACFPPYSMMVPIYYKNRKPCGKVFWDVEIRRFLARMAKIHEKNARNSSRCKHVKYQKVISKLIKNQFTQAALYVLQTATLLNLDDFSSRTPRTWFAYFCNPSYVSSSFVFLIKMICIRSALQQIGKPSFRAFPVSRMSGGKLEQFNVLGFLRKLKLFLDFSSCVLKL